MTKKIIAIISIALVGYGLWFTFVDFNVFFPILLRNEKHIVSTFEPNDLTIYKSLIPKEFEIPEQPKVKIDFVQVTPDWHECYVSIRVNYNGKPTWHALTWAIDTYVPYKLGRWVGYPKFMADSMVYTLGENNANQRVIKDSKLFMSMDFTENKNVKHNYCASEWEGTEIYHLLAPPLESPQINRLTFEFLSLLKPSEYIEQHGSITLHFDGNQPWSKLISNDNSRSTEGIYFKRNTTELLLLYAKKIN
jgi:hypothetical protein